jgi:hypothetical protein
LYIHFHTNLCLFSVPYPGAIGDQSSSPVVTSGGFTTANVVVKFYSASAVRDLRTENTYVRIEKCQYNSIASCTQFVTWTQVRTDADWDNGISNIKQNSILVYTFICVEFVLFVFFHSSMLYLVVLHLLRNYLG